MVYVLMKIGGRKRRIKGRKRGPGLLIQSQHEKKKELEIFERAKKRNN